MVLLLNGLDEIRINLRFLDNLLIATFDGKAQVWFALAKTFHFYLLRRLLLNLLRNTLRRRRIVVITRVQL